MKIYHYPKCSTCRKALAFLDSQHVDYEAINIVESPPSKSQLKIMLNSYDGELRRLFNTSGLQYRELKLKDKIPDMSASEAVDLLADNGMLIKRPFLIQGKQGLVGFKQDQWQALLEQTRP